MLAFLGRVSSFPAILFGFALSLPGVLVMKPLPAQGEAYYFPTAGLPDGAGSFVDKWCGPDMLPYTADDIDLPERGNSGGTWGFSWIDANGDGAFTADEHIFVVIRRGDDDAHTFSTRSYPQYGVLAESENWIDYHDAQNEGPSAAETGDPGPEGDDFEHNDRPGGSDVGWEDASNYYAYNNARANQWGFGGTKYYFEHRNGEGLDEIESFKKYLSFQNNKDDPATPTDERGACRNQYMRSIDAETKGLLIPVADIGGLQDGDLDPLFGWYGGDMAKYVREVLGPKLEDPALEVFVADSGCARSGLPATHVMILQIECPIKINPSGDCSDPSVAEALAAYWGIEPITPGEPETEAVYRVSHVLLFNDELTQTDMAGVRPFVTEPDDGTLRNLWVQDDFWRGNSANIGRYVLGGNWSIADDTSMDRGCAETDKYFLLPGGESGFFEAPLGAEVDTSDGAIYAIAEVGQVEIPVPAGGGAGIGDVASFQLSLMNDGAVVAYAEFDPAGSSVNIGGTLGPNGLAANPTKTMAGGPAEIPLFDPISSEFTRLVLRLGPGSIRLGEAATDEYTSNDYIDIDAYDVLASLDEGVSSEVDAVRFATSGDIGVLAVVVDGFAVFANLDPDGGRQKPGDENQDGKLDIADPVAILNHLFLGTNPTLPCGDGSINDPANVKLLDSDGDNQINIADPVALLNYLFTGGLPPAPCSGVPSCPCLVIPGCPQITLNDCAP